MTTRWEKARANVGVERPAIEPSYHNLTFVAGQDGDDKELYESIMLDVHVKKTGRYVIVREPKFQTMQATAQVVVVMDYIDKGPPPLPSNKKKKKKW